MIMIAVKILVVLAMGSFVFAAFSCKILREETSRTHSARLSGMSPFALSGFWGTAKADFLGKVGRNTAKTAKMRESVKTRDFLKLFIVLAFRLLMGKGSDELARLFDEPVQGVVGDLDEAAVFSVVDEEARGFQVDDRTRAARKGKALVLFDRLDLTVLAAPRKVTHGDFGEGNDLCAACREERLADDGIDVDQACELLGCFFHDAVDLFFLIHFKNASNNFFPIAIERMSPLNTVAA